MIKKEVVRLVGVLLVILFISFFIYPTPYYYTTMSNGDALFKVNRITGKIKGVSGITGGWVQLGNSHGMPTPTPSK